MLQAAKGDVVLLSHAAHVQDGIAHAAQSGVDTHAGDVGNFFETEVLIVAHEDYFALIVRQMLHEFFYICQRLLVGKNVLGAVVVEGAVVEKVAFGLVVGDGIFVALVAELVDEQVVRNASEPSIKLAGLYVAALLDGHDGFDEGLLKEIVGQVGILNNIINVGVELVFVAFQQNIERLILTRNI